MSVLSLVSAHGSPGVTTTALALAATWPQHRRCIVVEADISGGVIAVRFGMADTPGLVSLAAAARRGGLSDELVREHTQTLPGGLPVLVGPPSPDESQVVLRDTADELVGWATVQSDLDVIVDGGRISTRSAPSMPLLRAGPVMVVARPTVDQLRPAGIRCEALKTADSETSLLLVGDQPHGPSEVAAALHCPVVGVIAWDPKTAAVLAGTPGAIGSLRRSQLIRSAATLAAALAPLPHSDSAVATGDSGSVAPSAMAREVGS
ncbi:MAG: chromosome partitioning protein [Acidimicrobiia bacterium]|nr:chromosome partitioning protein [Acidimicrobiia bacterium]